MINLTIASNNKEQPLLSLNDVVSLTLPTQTGVITVLEGHMNLMSLLAAGKIVIKSSDYEKEIDCNDGVIYIDNHSNVRIMSI